MTDDRDEPLFQRAAMALRAAGPRDEAALLDAIAVVRREASNAHDVTGVATFSTGSPRLERRARLRRRSLFDHGTIRFVAGVAAGIAFAAGLGIGLFAGWRMRGESHRLAMEDAARAAASTPVAKGATGSSLRPVQFMLVAPSAARVALVGEFNDWDPAATPMSRASGGAWHVALPLASGRHVYAFVVDGSSWVADPQAPLAPERWFGERNSVLLVNGEQRQ